MTALPERMKQFEQITETVDKQDSGDNPHG